MVYSSLYIAGLAVDERNIKCCASTEFPDRAMDELGAVELLGELNPTRLVASE